MSITTVGNIQVLINTESIKGAVVQLDRLINAADKAQRSFEQINDVRLDSLAKQVQALRLDLDKVGNSASSSYGKINALNSVNVSSVINNLTNLNGAVIGIGSNASGSKALLQQMVNVNTSAAVTQINTLNQAINSIGSAGSSAMGGGGAGGVISGLISQIGVLVAIGATIKVADKILDIGKAAYDAYQPVQSLIMGLNAMGNDGVASLNMMRATANSLGVEFQSITKSALQWNATVSGTGIEGEKADQIFRTMTGTIKLFGGGADEVNGALKALTQMMSKGTVQSEELKGQLGERLPGAFRLMAESLGMSTNELTKALKDGMVDSEYAITKLSDHLRDKYGNSIAEAANTTQSKLNIMKNDWSVVSAAVGKDIDTWVGKIAELVLRWGGLRSMADGAAADDAKESGVRAAKINGLSPEEQARITAEEYNRMASGRARGGMGLPKVERKTEKFNRMGDTKQFDVRTETWEQALARTISENRNNPAFNNVMTPTLNFNANMAGNTAQFRDDIKSKADKAQQQQQDIKFNRQMADVVAMGDVAGQIRLKIQKLKEEIPNLGKGLDPMAREQAVSAEYLKIAGLEAQLKKLDTKNAKAGARAGARAADQSETAQERADRIIRSGTDRYQAIVNKNLELVDTEEGRLAVALAENNKYYQERIDDIDKIDNLSDEAASKAKAQLAILRQNREEELKRNDALEKRNKQQALWDKGQIAIADYLARMETKRNEISGKVDNFLSVEKAASEKASDTKFAETVAKNDPSTRLRSKDEFTVLDKATEAVKDKRELLARTEQKLAETIRDLEAINTSFAEIQANKSVIALRSSIDDQIKDTERTFNWAKKEFTRQQTVAKSWQQGAGEAAVKVSDNITKEFDVAGQSVLGFADALNFTLGHLDSLGRETDNAWKGFFRTMLQGFAKMTTDILIMQPLMESIKNFSKGSAGGGLISTAANFITMAITGGADVGGNAGYGDYSSAGLAKAFNANGGVFDNNTRFLSGGGIVSRSTTTQVLGEQGPEAVIPLKRDARGRLGVSGSSGSTTIAPVFSVVIQGDASEATIARVKTELLPLVDNIARNRSAEAITNNHRPGGKSYR